MSHALLCVNQRAIKAVNKGRVPYSARSKDCSSKEEMLQFRFSAAASVFLCFAASLMVLLTTIKAVPTDEYYDCGSTNTSTFSPNSTYQANLEELLSWLSSNSSTSKNGFYNATAGNTVYGAFLCRGDLTTGACQDCVSTAANRVLQKCPRQKESTIWYAECMLRYSNQSFFSADEEEPVLDLMNTAYVGDTSVQSSFMTLMTETINAAAKQAAKGGDDKKFATKEANFSSFQTLYTLAQCTPALSEFSCQKCLTRAITSLPSFCYGRQGGRVLGASCTIRYELYPFYHTVNTSVLTPEEPRSKSKGKTRISAVIIIAIVAPIMISLLLFFFAFWIISMRARKKHSSVPEESVQISTVDYLLFDLDTIIMATNNFSDDNKIGAGGFGEVYKGSLPNGQDIAVKRLSRSSMQGAEEFKNEVVLVAKLQHRNLVRLLGFCLDGEEKILIYEFVPNKSLDYFLFDPEKQRLLDWSRRYKIIQGIARGMLYLHEDSQLRIIHRDLKTSNILLDDGFNAKISDFGMARIVDADQTQENTRRVVGTFGYMPPEYAIHGDFSIKTDVYSFGVLVLEIISGKKNTSFRESGYAEDLLSYAWKTWRDGTPLELLDTTLRNSYSRGEVSRCIHIALSCVQEDPAQRPTMQTIVLMLNSHSVTLATPERPAGYLHSENQQIFPTRELEFSDITSKSKSIPDSVDHH